jgi:hypothetical protein
LNGEMSINKAYNKALKKPTSVTVEFGNEIYPTIKENDEFLLRKRLERIDWVILGTGKAPDMNNFPKSEPLSPKGRNKWDEAKILGWV